MYTVDGELRTGEVVSSFEEVSVDSNNDGVFCIIRKNGGFEETQIV